MESTKQQRENAERPDPAILFEFRTVPNELSGFLPQTESNTQVDVNLLDQFDANARRAVIGEVNSLINNSGDDFDNWYQAYRENKGQPPVKNAKKSASANLKAEWVMANKPDEWTRIAAQV